MTICTYNARTLASEAAIEGLVMQAKKIKYDVIRLTVTRRRHPRNEAVEELFLRTCDSRGVGGVGVLINTSMAKNIDSFKQITTRFDLSKLVLDHIFSSADEKMWSNTSFDNLRRLRSNIKLRRRRS
ncbi:hypothetical protein NECAME_06049 [Necator americanus]|uniref:Uncharacterized protein n=1 Tax=Necator americanus TaxID=51031 RepID=W2TWD4_NECAM|nr:hypothetical protein NECAME_06049 [Necator americanus]ETN86168.1 hypothetical protein NECAME_06049 [Necator americanus]